MSPVKSRAPEESRTSESRTCYGCPEFPADSSAGEIRRISGEFVASGEHGSYVQFEKNGSRTTLQERNGFLTLCETIQSRNQPTTYALFTSEKQRLNLNEWHDILGHIDPSASSHLKKHDMIEITHAITASEITCSACKKCKSQALSHGRGGRSPKRLGEVVHPDLERSFKPDVMGHQYFQIFVNEASRDKRVRGLKIQMQRLVQLLPTLTRWPTRVCT